MKKVLIALLVCSIALIYTGCSQPQTKTTVPTVTKTEVKKSVVEGDGVIKVGSLTSLVIDFPAIIQKVPFKDGQRVKKGDVLFTLNYNEFLRQIKNQETQIATLQSDISRLKSDLAVTSSGVTADCNPDLLKLFNDIKTVEDLYKKGLDDLAVKEQLYKSGSIPKSQVDDFKVSVDAKKKDVEDMKYALDIKLYNKKIELDQKVSNLAIMQNDLKTMNEKLKKSYISGNNIICETENGVIYNVGYLPGDFANAAQKAANIMDMSTMYIEAIIDEDYIKDVKVGAEVTINPHSDKSKTYKGKVTKILGKAVEKDSETKVPVEISLENVDKLDGLLIPDLNVDVQIKI